MQGAIDVTACLLSMEHGAGNVAIHVIRVRASLAPDPAQAELCAAAIDYVELMRGIYQP